MEACGCGAREAAPEAHAETALHGGRLRHGDQGGRSPEPRQRSRSMGGGLSARPVLAPGRGLPLRLLTRRKEVAWIWAGEAGGEPLLLCQYICDNAL